MPLMSVKLKNRILKADPTLEVHLRNIRVNADPRGCSGFIVNPANGKVVYVDTEESVYGPLRGKILYRTAEHTKDFTGGVNRWATDETLVADVLQLLK